MGMSNTAVPKYYGAFRESVIRGDIPINREIEMEMHRIDALIANPNIFYDGSKVEGWISFCESELTLTDGRDLKMLDTFKLWGEQIFGWYYFVKISVPKVNPDGSGIHYVNRYVKKRLINKQYLIVGRGAAKTIYDTCIHAYGLVVDPDTTHQITVAPVMVQAEEVMQPLSTAISRAKGPVFKFLTRGSLQNTTGSKANRKHLASTKIGIQNFFTNSYLEVRHLSINALQGLRVKYATIDEWLSGDLREDPMTAIEQGASKGDVPDYVIVGTSSEGTVRNGAGDSIKMELMKILKGEYVNPHVSIFWYKLDSIDEISNPAMWLKANPNLGKTVSYETYQLDVEKAEHNPSARNDIIAKRFGIPMEGFTYFFPYEETLPHIKREYWGMRCAVGGDLSKGDDFCSFAFIFPLRDYTFGIKTRSYISEQTFINLKPALRDKYNEFIAEGSLMVLNGTIIDNDEVYADLQEYILANQYDIACFGYDPYNAKSFLEQWIMDYSEYGTVKVPQGVKTESVPLGEIKKLSEERLLLFDEAIMQFAMENCIVMEDTNGNRKLLKKRREDKIDPVAAVMDAYIAFKQFKEEF